MRVEATPPLFSMSAENRLTATAPLRETSKVAEMTALASSAARAGVGNGERGETVMKGGGWGVMFFLDLFCGGCGWSETRVRGLCTGREYCVEDLALYTLQMTGFFSKKPGLWSKCGVIRVGRCKGLSMACYGEKEEHKQCVCYKQALSM